MPLLMAYKKLIRPCFLIVGICLSACSEHTLTTPFVDQALQVTRASPIVEQVPAMQNVESFDLYVDDETTHAVFTATGEDKQHPLIGYLHSEDGGQHWSTPVEIAKQFNLSVLSRAGNDVQIAASGENLLVILQSVGELPGMGPLAVIYSTDAGKTWQKGQNPTGTANDQSHSDLAADQLGRFHLVWLDDRDENGYQGLRYAGTNDAGQHWDLQQTIDESSCSCCWNRMLVTDSGLINVLYRDMERRDMALAQSADYGQTWKQVAKVGNFDWKFDGCPHNGGGITEAGKGDLHAVVWTGKENQTGLYHLFSSDTGANWSMPQVIGEGTSAFHSDIAAIDERRLAVIWDAMGPEGTTIFIADSSDNGHTWSIPQAISTPGVTAAFPRIVREDSGWLAMWVEQQTKTSKKWVSALIH